MFRITFFFHPILFVFNIFFCTDDYYYDFFFNRPFCMLLYGHSIAAWRGGSAKMANGYSLFVFTVWNFPRDGIGVRVCEWRARQGLLLCPGPKVGPAGLRRGGVFSAHAASLSPR